MAISDNSGNIIAPLIVKAVNVHDSILFDESFYQLMDTADLLEIDLKDTPITFDSAFDSKMNKGTILTYQLKPVIYPNKRNIKNSKKKRMIFEEFDTIKEIYQQRYKIERAFAWEDTYRKLVIRYEKLQCTHLGFKYLAFSMMNFRHLFQG